MAGSDEVYPDQQSAAVFYSPLFIEQHPEEAQGFMNAYVRGLRDYNDAFEKGINKDEIIAILAKHTKADPKVFQSAVPVGLHPDGMVNVQSLRDDARWYRKHGYLEQEPDIDAIVDMSFATKAAEKLGAYE
jgi:NitT/TauT family transport system substrate-binding protein